MSKKSILIFYASTQIPELEEKILKEWDEKIFSTNRFKSPRARAISSFFEGPPTANGKPGIHHFIARYFKDVIFALYRRCKDSRRPQGRLGHAWIAG